MEKHYSSHWPDFKRLLELCCADQDYLNKFLSDPEKTLKNAGLLSLHTDIAKEAAEIIFARMLNPDTVACTNQGNEYINLLDDITKTVHVAFSNRAGEIADSNFKAWYERQIKRILFENAMQ